MLVKLWFWLELEKNAIVREVTKGWKSNWRALRRSFVGLERLTLEVVEGFLAYRRPGATGA